MTELLHTGATLERLYHGAEWGEGPVWLTATRSLRWSDIPNDRILEFDAETGNTRVHRTEVEYTNGRTLDLDGTVVQCSHGRRSIEREIDGIPITIVDRWSGGRFNSPNDVIVASDGTIWFTDPPYGLHESGREGNPGHQEYGGCFVFRYDPKTDAATPVITDMVHPNGLAFSPDESVLYVADTGFAWDKSAPRHIRTYDVSNGEATAGRLFVEPTAMADGFRVDIAGRVWTSSGTTVEVYSPSGELLLTIPVPEPVSNLTFGGDDGHELYITASTSLYRIRTTTRQASRP